MATVKLHRPGWTNHTWAPHGMYQPIRFDSDDKAEVDVDTFNEWIGDDMARVVGIVVTRPPDKKEPAKKKAKAASK